MSASFGSAATAISRFFTSSSSPCHARLVDAQRLLGRSLEDLAGARVEGRAVAVTDDPVPFELAFCERALLMGAGVVECCPGTVVEQRHRDLDAVDEDSAELARPATGPRLVHPLTGEV